MAEKNKRTWIQDIRSSVGQKMLQQQMDWLWEQVTGKLPQKALSSELQGTINSKATQADLNTTNGNVSTLSTEIIQAANTIRLAAGLTETTDLGVALETVMSEVILTPGRITLAVTNNNVHVGLMPPTGDGLYEGRLWQNKLTNEQLRWKGLAVSTDRSYSVTNATPTVRIDDLSDDLEIAVTTTAAATVTLTKTNLLKKGVTITHDGVTMTVGTDGTIVLTGTCTAAAGGAVFFPILMGYYLSGEHTLSAGNTVAYGTDLQMRLWQAASTQVASPSTSFSVNTIGAKKTFTLSNQFVYAFAIRVQGGVTYNATLKPQLEKSAAPTAYEAPDHVVYTADGSGEAAVIGRDGVNCIVSSALSLSCAYTGSGWTLVSGDARRVYASSSFTVDENGATVHHILLDGVTPYEAYTRLYGGGLMIYDSDTDDLIGGLAVRGGKVILSASGLADPRVSSKFFGEIRSSLYSYSVGSGDWGDFGLMLQYDGTDIGGISVVADVGDATFDPSDASFFVGGGDRNVVITPNAATDTLGSGATLPRGYVIVGKSSMLFDLTASGGYTRMLLSQSEGGLCLAGNIRPNWGSYTGLYTLGENATNRKWDYIYLLHNPVVGSDERIKRDFCDIPDAMTFINALKPTAYRLKTDPDDAPLRMGFGANKTLGALESAGMSGFGVVDTSNPDCFNIAYDELLAPLVSVAQYQQRRIDALEARLSGPRWVQAIKRFFGR